MDDRRRYIFRKVTALGIGAILAAISARLILPHVFEPEPMSAMTGVSYGLLSLMTSFLSLIGCGVTLLGFLGLLIPENSMRAAIKRTDAIIAASKNALELSDDRQDGYTSRAVAEPIPFENKLQTDTNTPVYGSEFEKFRGELDKNIQTLKDYEVKFLSAPFSKSLTGIIGTLKLILEYTDEKECRFGNLKRLNPQFLPAFISLLKQYDNLLGLRGASDVDGTLKKLSDTIIESESAFKNILSEAVESEKWNAEVDSNLLLQQAAMNGIYADQNTLVLKSGK